MPANKAFPAVHGSLLVVEDDTELAPLLRDVLEMSGYDVHLAPSRGAALDLLAGPHAVVAAVLDIALGDGSVLEVADQLQAQRVPYVFATGGHALEMPARHRWAPFFNKPFPICTLIDAVETARAEGVPHGQTC